MYPGGGPPPRKMEVEERQEVLPMGASQTQDPA